MKKKGCSMIFVNNNNEILLLLRDNIKSIPYPNMWDLPGGHVEHHETPDQCIIREMNEEMGINLKSFELFKVTEFNDRTEYTFWQKNDLNIDNIDLTEGQKLKWFSENKLKKIDPAFGFAMVIKEFFEFYNKNQ